MKPLILGPCAVAAALLLAWPAGAQAPSPAAQKSQGPTDSQSFDDWGVRCFAGILPPCEMFQVTQNKAGKRLTSIAIAYLPRRGSYAIQLTVPLGISFAKGVRLTASSYASQAMPYLRCDRTGCYAQGAIEQGALDRLGRGEARAKLTVGSMAGRDIDIPFSLRGFSNAREAMEKLAREKFAALAPAKR
jgi:invasion protein IalB